MSEPNISEHCTYAEATDSPTAARKGITNTPTAAQLVNMRLVAEQCFEPARRGCGPLRVTSFFRSPKLNQAVGGAKTSAHLQGQAIDMEALRMTNADLFRWCRLHLEFDQLIWEYGDDAQPAWVHVAWRAEGNRKQALQVRRVDGAAVYTPYTDP